MKIGSLRLSVLLSVLYDSLISYPAPINLTYFWNFGVYSLICLVIQIITGLFLAMHYTAESDLAFLSVEHIMRDVNYGWFLRYMSMLMVPLCSLLLVYTHTWYVDYIMVHLMDNLVKKHGLYRYFSTILINDGITAFMGYVLPWGQMSYWAATVITSLVAAVPIVGNSILVVLWGDFVVEDATIHRFFSLHFFFSFVILAFVFVHLLLLHSYGSNNSAGFKFFKDSKNFYPYYFIKDFYGILVFFLIFSIFVMFLPNSLGHPDNYIEASSLITPSHIVPEWYFLPFYAILRAVPNKLGGVCLLLVAIFILFLLPFIYNPKVLSNKFRPISRFFFWYIIVLFFFLGLVGSETVDFPFTELGQLVTFFYFYYFCLIIPVLIKVENFFWRGYA